MFPHENQIATADNNCLWSNGGKFLFRFFFIYFIIYAFPFPFDSFDITKIIAKPYYDFLDFIIPKTGKWLFNIDAKTAFPMFDKVDDSGYGLVFLYSNLILSITAAAIWSIADRSKANYEKSYQGLKLYLKYFLIAYLFGYGFIKIFPSQFQSITASRLVMPVGDQSPMLLAWNFMGYSKVFSGIMGITEVLAGLLLFFRRTTTLGAILSLCTFGFITLMDVCFNVPVRLLASHLFIVSLFLIHEDRKKLMNVFLLNKTALATIYTPVISNKTGRLILQGLQVVFAVCIIYKTSGEAVESAYSFGQFAPRGPLYGVYHTNVFIRNNDTIPPLESDTLRWKGLVIDGGSWGQSGIIKLQMDKTEACNIEIDTVKKMMRLESGADTSEKYFLNYFLPDADHMMLQGYWKKDSIKLLLSKYNLSNYKLYSQRFTLLGN